jgi:arginine/lysine/ornithine decarboxylase
MMDQQKTPLYDALMDHVRKQPMSLHVPGHKSGRVFPEKGYKNFKEILPLDVTELTGLDDLHDPADVILEAEALLSSLYGSRKSFFLVNGTTVGNLSMVLSVCKADDVVLVQRNCHKSIMNGLMIAGARPVFLSPEFDEESQVPTYISERKVLQAIEEHPQAKAIIITNPNYYGYTYELSNIVKHAHRKEIPVLVDEAHGAHFGVGQPFPESALKSGADIVVQSAHKTLPAMTMGSFLHFQSDLVPLEHVAFYLKALQSSSPSYPIMASLDLARYYLANLREEGVESIVKQIEILRSKLMEIPQLCVIQAPNEGIQLDPLKLIIQSRCQLTGYEIQGLLEKIGFYTELSDPLNVLCILPLGNINTDFIISRVKQAFVGIKPLPNIEDKKYIRNVPIHSKIPYSFSKLNSMKTRLINIEESVNEISAQTVVPYPPGIPLLLQGEIIKEAHLKQLAILQGMGANIQGNLVHQNINIYDCDKEEKDK